MTQDAASQNAPTGKPCESEYDRICDEITERFMDEATPPDHEELLELLRGFFSSLACNASLPIDLSLAAASARESLDGRTAEWAHALDAAYRAAEAP